MRSKVVKVKAYITNCSASQFYLPRERFDVSGITIQSWYSIYRRKTDERVRSYKITLRYSNKLAESFAVHLNITIILVFLRCK